MNELKAVSKSLIIHQVYSHEIMTVSVFEYLNLTTIDFTIYFSVFSRVSVLIAKIYQTFKTVFDQTNTPQSSSKFVKNTPLRVVFSFLEMGSNTNTYEAKLFSPKMKQDVKLLSRESVLHLHENNLVRKKNFS